ncbi:hypothetical protein V500_02327 [Pseudogymnoascus sp. VKM F-4518 (FW-2643)]|nr:hypothetical protein V500_02327 [Pseudogymnoascus sp. VKM F-4518 (FW-2643)]
MVNNRLKSRDSFGRAISILDSEILVIEEATTTQDAQSPNLLTTSLHSNSFYGRRRQDLEVRITRQSTPEASAPKRPHDEAFPEADTEIPRDSDMHNGLGDKILTKMRSSIACIHCRRSKIKCQNSGTNSACRACDTNSRACIYPAGQQAKSAGPLRNEGEGGEVQRARKRKLDDVRKQSLRYTDDPFQSPPITPTLWKDVYNTFILHCSAELPFLHDEVFYAYVQPTTERSVDTQIYLLGMLTLTARFIPDLIAFHNPLDPLAASEFYAEASATRLNVQALTGQPTLERVQGLLMISLYHWGMHRRQCAWMNITIATTMAHTLGLMFDEDLRTNWKPAPLARARSNEQIFIQREIKRRTAYSCFILDRYQSMGQYQPQIINIDELNIHLPCSEEDFLFGTIVKTRLLKDSLQSPDSNESSRTISTTQVLSIYIQLVEIWGRFSHWSSRGGRQKEEYPPWDQRSEFYKLQQQLVSFYKSLPPKLTFNPTNITAHIASRSVTLYTAIHTLYSLCNIVLHYDYIPFLPLRSDGLSGPLDEPRFLLGKYDIPEGFWEESAELVFKSARDIVDIVRVTSDRQVMVESPQVGIAVRTAASVGVYSINFPDMDKNSYMCDPPSTPTLSAACLRKGATGLAIKALDLMKPKSKMACYWSDWIGRMHGYFDTMKRHHLSSIEAPDLPWHQVHLAQIKGISLREGSLSISFSPSLPLARAARTLLPPSLEIRHGRAVDCIRSTSGD